MRRSRAQRRRLRVLSQRRLGRRAHGAVGTENQTPSQAFSHKYCRLLTWCSRNGREEQQMTSLLHWPEEVCANDGKRFQNPLSGL
jgi:hypothetical protein